MRPNTELHHFVGHDFICSVNTSLVYRDPNTVYRHRKVSAYNSTENNQKLHQNGRQTSSLSHLTIWKKFLIFTGTYRWNDALIAVATVNSDRNSKIIWLKSDVTSFSKEKLLRSYFGLCILLEHYRRQIRHHFYEHQYRGDQPHLLFPLQWQQNYIRLLSKQNLIICTDKSSSSRMTTLGDMDSTSRALSIPPVLVCIFKHLPARDVINARGVCKLWNKYCDCEPRFVFRKFDLHPEGIDVLLRNTNCRRLNLEFQDCDLKYISDEMWQTWSPKLRSLRVYGCTTEIGSLQSIISNCVRLEVLKIVLKCYINGNLLEQLLDQLIEREERHIRLRTLLINGQSFMKMSHFSKLLTVFPCIEVLHCNVGRGGDGRYTCGHSYGTYDLRKFRRNHALCSERPVPPMLDYQLFRLTTYKTILMFSMIFKNVSIKEQLLHFFTVQKDLEVIDFQINRLSSRADSISDDDFGIFIKSLVFYVLRTCSKLREFRLQHEPIPDQFFFVKLTSEEFVQFFSLISNLQCFKIPFILKTDTSETTVLPLSLPSLSLSVLQLNTKEPYFLSILKLSPRLKHLDIDVYSDQQLREIILSMPNLEILNLQLHGCTNYGFTGENEKSSIQRLQKLEYLHIIDCEGCITKEVFEEFSFPRLEYLGLCLKRVDTLPKNLLNMPALKTLKLYMNVRNFWWMPEVIAELCKSLRNLKHLIVYRLDSESVLANQKKLDIFNSLSNLKFISCCMYSDTFIFDRLSGRASSSETCKLQFREDKF